MILWSWEFTLIVPQIIYVIKNGSEILEWNQEQCTWEIGKASNRDCDLCINKMPFYFCDQQTESWFEAIGKTHTT